MTNIKNTCDCVNIKRSSPKRQQTKDASLPPVAGDSQVAFAQRLGELIKSAGSARALADASGVSPNAIHLWLKGSEPGRDKLVALAKAAEVSIAWLASGLGPKRGMPESYVLVRRYETAEGLIYPGVDYLALKSEWIQSLPGKPSPTALLLVQVEDDSMAPTMSRGDLVLANTQDREVAGGGIYIVHRKKPPWVNLVRRIVLKSDGRLQMLCDNQAYALAIDSEFVVFGRVIWSGGLL